MDKCGNEWWVRDIAYESQSLYRVIESYIAYSYIAFVNILVYCGVVVRVVYKGRTSAVQSISEKRS